MNGFSPRRTAALAAVLALGLGAAVAYASAKPRSAKSAVPAAPGSPLPDATGTITMKFYPASGARAERSWIRVQAKRLAKSGSYQLFIDDPVLPGEDLLAYGDFVAASGKGGLNELVDTKKGGLMPSARSLDELGGAAFELRDVQGAPVLRGALPTLPPPP